MTLSTNPKRLLLNTKSPHMPSSTGIKKVLHDCNESKKFNYVRGIKTLFCVSAIIPIKCSKVNQDDLSDKHQLVQDKQCLLFHSLLVQIQESSAFINRTKYITRFIMKIFHNTVGQPLNSNGLYVYTFARLYIRITIT